MPPSKESRALKELFQTLGSQFPADGNSFLERAVYDQVHRAASEASGVSYKDGIVAGRPCIWFYPENASPKHVLLYFHGGGFSFGSPMSHRKLTAHLAKACGIIALSIDYRLAPEHSYPEPLDDCVNAYKWLLDNGYPAENIVFAGDSAGGSLATGVPLAAMANGLSQPAASVALSPCYDLTHVGETMNTNRENDVLNGMEFCTKLADRYAGNVPKDDPMVSPIFADMKSLPPQWISCGGHDMLLDNGTRLAEKAKAAGVEVVLEVHEGQQHVMEFMAGNAPEADKSIARIGEWVRTKIGLAPPST